MRRTIETASLLVLIGVATIRPLIEESYDSSGSPFTRALEVLADPSPLRTLVLDTMILLAALGWALPRAIRPGGSYRWTGLELGGALVLLAAVVSCPVAGNKRLAINAAIDWLCLPILTIALVQLLRCHWHRRLLLAALLATACVQAAQCLEQRFGRYGGFEDTLAHYESIKQDFWARQGVDLDSPRVRAFEDRLRARETTGFLSHSNIAGSYLVLCAFAAIGATVTACRRLQPARASASAEGRKNSIPPDRNSAQAEACGSSRRITAWFGLRSVAGALATGLIIFGAILTRSTGALTAGAVGLFLLLIGAALKKRVEAYRARTLLIGWACVAAGVVAVIGYGLKHDRLPGWSLTFRWHYWKASSAMIADHALTGVGRENFGRHYLRYKPIQSAEEVANPHNLFVQAAADWGIPGLAGILAMMGGTSVVLARCFGHQKSLATPLPSRDKGRGEGEARATPLPSRKRGRGEGGAFIAAAALLAAVVTLGRLPLLGTSDPNFLYYATVTTGIYWIIGFACFAAAGWARAGLDAPAAGIVRIAATLGLFAFLLHDMINFAMFVPAAATTFFALLAYCISRPTSDSQPLSLPETGQGHKPPLPSRERGRGEGEGKDEGGRIKDENGGVSSLHPWKGGAAPVAAIGCWLIVAAILTALTATTLFGVLPVARAGSALRLARQAGEELAPVSLAAQLADRCFQHAAELDALDPTPLVERAQWSMRASAIPERRAEAFRIAVQSVKQGIGRDPFNNRLRRMLTQVFQAKANATRDTEAHVEALKAAQDALKLYPHDPEGIVTLADCQVDAAQATGFEELFDDALRNYRRALRLDDSRPLWAKLAGLSPRQRATIEAKITHVEQLLTDRSP